MGVSVIEGVSSPGLSGGSLSVSGSVGGVNETFIPHPLLQMPLDEDLRLLFGSGAATFTRSTTGTHVDKDDGLVKTAAIDVVRFETNGVFIEGASTNEALHSRDFTNAVHVKTGITALKDAIGADGVTNAASTLTATAPNGTAFQTVTKASAENAFSIGVRRKTGTGVIEITDDGGVGFTDITSLINSATYTRFQITTTQANPSFGVRIVTSGDEIEVDYEGLEELPFASSRIPTTTTAVARTSEDLSLPISGNFNTTEGAILLRADVIGDTGGVQTLLEISDNSNNNQITLRRHFDQFRLTIRTANVTQVDIFSGLTMDVGQTYKVLINYKDNDVELFIDDVSVGSDTSVTMPSTLTTIDIGKTISGSQLYGHIKDLKTFDVELTPNQAEIL
jgi:hypothetical protein